MEHEEFKKILFCEDFIYEDVDAEIKKYTVNKRVELEKDNKKV